MIKRRDSFIAIAESNILKGKRAGHLARQCDRVFWCGDFGFSVEHFSGTVGRAGRTHDFAIDFRQHAKARSCIKRVEHHGGEIAKAHGPSCDGPRAHPEHTHKAAKQQHRDQNDHQRPRPDPAHRRIKRRLDRLGKCSQPALFPIIGLNQFDCV